MAGFIHAGTRHTLRITRPNSTEKKTDSKP